MDGLDEKLLIPANRITAETNGSVRIAARMVPAAAPIDAVIPNRKENAMRSIPAEHPMDLQIPRSFCYAVRILLPARTVTMRINTAIIPYINARSPCIAEIIPKSPGQEFSCT